MSTADPWQFFAPEEIAMAAAPNRLDAVLAQWPLVAEQLVEHACFDRPTAIAAIATIAVEAGLRFAPIEERGETLVLEARYGLHTPSGQALDNTAPGDGARYRGRGLLPLRGRERYRRYGEAVGARLEASPVEALQPRVAAAILARYFVDHGIPAMARRDDWEGVRRVVSEHLDGWSRFIACVRQLKGMVSEEEPVTVAPPPGELARYDPTTPPAQDGPFWTCAVRTTAWLLNSIKIDVDRTELAAEMVVFREVDRDRGLLDPRGDGIAAALSRHLPPGLAVEVIKDDVTLEVATARAGRGPLALGGRNWGHWTAVRRVNGRHALELMNPTRGWLDVDDELTEAHFERLGPWSLVFVYPVVALRPRTEVAELDADRARIADLEAAVARLADELLVRAAHDPDPADRHAAVEEAQAIRVRLLGESTR